MYRHIAKIVSNDQLWSKSDQCYIHIHVITKRVIKRSRCNIDNDMIPLEISVLLFKRQHYSDTFLKDKSKQKLIKNDITDKCQKLAHR